MQLIAVLSLPFFKDGHGQERLTFIPQFLCTNTYQT